MLSWGHAARLYSFVKQSLGRWQLNLVLHCYLPFRNDNKKWAWGTQKKSLCGAVELEVVMAL